MAGDLLSPGMESYVSEALQVDMPCPYSTALGIRGQGFHSSRILGFALNDILGTLGLAMITSYMFNGSLLYNFLVWFILGEVLHLAYGVDTAFLELFGLNKCLI